MGYDMHFVRKDEDEDERVAIAHALWEESIKVRDAYCQAHPGAQGRHTRAEFTAGGFDGAPANADPEYKRLQAAQNVLYEQMYAEERSYYRLNVWGMQTMRRLMGAFNMLYLGSEGHSGDWPDVPEGYYDWDDAEGQPSEGTEVSEWNADQVAAFEAYRKRSTELLSAGPEPARGIPAWKLGSNDGWVVRPDEIRAALRTLSDRIQDEGDVKLMQEVLDRHEVPMDWWQRWVAWLMEAMEHDGFRVY